MPMTARMPACNSSKGDAVPARVRSSTISSRLLLTTASTAASRRVIASWTWDVPQAIDRPGLPRSLTSTMRAAIPPVARLAPLRMGVREGRSSILADTCRLISRRRESSSIRSRSRWRICSKERPSCPTSSSPGTCTSTSRRSWAISLAARERAWSGRVRRAVKIGTPIDVISPPTRKRIIRGAEISVACDRTFSYGRMTTMRQCTPFVRKMQTSCRVRSGPLRSSYTRVRGGRGSWTTIGSRLSSHVARILAPSGCATISLFSLIRKPTPRFVSGSPGGCKLLIMLCS